MKDEILKLANRKGINYANEKYSGKYGHYDSVNQPETEIDFARGFVAGYFYQLDVKAKISPDRLYSRKIEETQYFVDRYIERHSVPPTYRIVADAFNITVCAAHARLRYYRHRMKHK